MKTQMAIDFAKGMIDYNNKALEKNADNLIARASKSAYEMMLNILEGKL